MPKLPERPKLVNRGASGLHTKIENGETTDYSALLPPGVEHAHNKIAERLLPDVVDIDSVFQDPNNARLHPERNLHVIRASLCVNGQYHALIARKSDGLLAVGNGRHQCMKELGWTKCGVHFRDMTDAEFASLALTDNRSAELASWDFEVITALDRIIQAAGMQTIGWSIDELEVLRAVDWTPPAVTDEEYGEVQQKERSVEFTEEQWASVTDAINVLNGVLSEEKTSAEALALICDVWRMNSTAQES